MTQETRNSEPVRAIWNHDLTLKICMPEDIAQEEISCRSTDCDEWAWCGDDGLPMVPMVAHYCAYCARRIDPAFAAVFERALLPIMRAQWPNSGVSMDELAAHFPLGVGIIERGL
jgi:hypothetical protein